MKMVLESDIEEIVKKANPTANSIAFLINSNNEVIAPSSQERVQK